MNISIAAAECSYKGCDQHPERAGEVNGRLIFSCETHTDSLTLQSGDKPRTINSTELENFIQSSQTLFSTLNRIKYDILLSAKKLTQTIQKHSEKSLTRLDSLLIIIRKNIQFVHSTQKIFDRIEAYVKKNSKKKPENSVLALEQLEGMTINYLTRDFFQPFITGAYHELLDIRLLSSKTPVSKKLQILSKTVAFKRNPSQIVITKDFTSLIPTSEKAILGNPDHLLLYLEKGLIITAWNQGLIRFWKIGHSIDKSFELNNNNLIIRDVLLLPSSNNLIIILKTGPRKFSITEQAFTTDQTNEIGTVIIAKFFSNNNFLATATYEGNIFIWNTETLNLEISFPVQRVFFNGSINCFDVSRTSKQIVSGGVSGEIFLRYVFKNGSEYRTSGHGDGVTVIAFSPNCAYIISGGDDNFIKIWEARDLSTVVFKKRVSDMRIGDVSFSWDSSLALTGGAKKVFVWRVGKEEKNIGFLKIDNRRILGRLAEYFDDALCYSKYF